MKRFLQSLLILAIVLAACVILNPTEAHAATTSDLTFKINSDGASYSVWDCKASASGTLTVPDTYNGKPVTVIGACAFENCTSLTKVILGNNITEIQVYAFRRCDGLTSVTIGNSVAKIGIAAFFNCDSLTGVTIPDSVTIIGSNAFCSCNSLNSVTIGNGVTTIGDHAFEYCNSLNSVTIPDSVTAIGEGAFASCKSLTAATIGSKDNPVGNNDLTIGERAFASCEKLSNLTIGNNVISIGDQAFTCCDSLTDVTIPDSVTTIDRLAFASCESLTGVTIGKSVATIGKNAFNSCPNLTGFCVDSDNPNYSNDTHGVLFNKDKTTLIAAPGAIARYTIPQSVTTIGNCAFSDCTSLIDITIPNSVTTIDGSAFDHCTGLTSVTIPGSVVTIGGSAFYFCTGLTGVTISDGVTAIGNSAFDCCTSLTDVTIPDSVTTLGNSVFRGCSSLTGVTIPDSVTALGNSMFSGCRSLSSITIPDSVTAFGFGAFENCTSLTEVTIPDSVITLGKSVFEDCTGLINVTIGNNVSIGACAFENCTGLTSVRVSDSSAATTGVSSTIGYQAFYNCESLTDVALPSTVTAIGNNAFAYCYSLTDISIPNGVTTIDYSTFRDCTSLTSITIPNSVTTIGDMAFHKCKALTNVKIPKNTVVIGSLVFSGCPSLTEITVDTNNPAFTSDSFGLLYNKEKTTLLAVPGAVVNCAIPDGVTSIDKGAFWGCCNLTALSIPDSVITIGEDAFIDCDSITDIVIPNSVTSIGESAFSSCANLCNVTLPNGITHISAKMFDYCKKLAAIVIPDSVTTIGDYAFYNCYSLSSVTIGNAVTKIGDYAFYGCYKVPSINIPVSVTSVGVCAFYYCRLTDVYYGGTQAQWGNISIGANNDPLKNATIHIDPCVANGHTMVIVPGKYATATEPGLTDGQKCSVCGVIQLAQQEIPIIDSAHTHSYENVFDKTCNACGAERETGNSYAFGNYRVVFADPDTTHKNPRVEVYKLGSQMVVDPSNETTLKAIDSSPVTHWGASSINKILITDAGNYVLLLKYNVGTGAATKVPMVISVSGDPKLVIDKNNKITAIETDTTNLYHRVVLYYLGENTVTDIQNETELKAIDSAPETIWNIRDINRIALIKGGNYVLHLCYNKSGSAKQTVAQQFTVESIPALSVDINNKVVVTEENAENKNHRAIAYYLGTNTVADPYDETAVKAAAVSTSWTYWGISEISRMELKEGGNYVIHLYYNVGTSEKRTLALDVTVNERPALSVDENGKITVSYTDTEVTNPRAYIYKIDDAEVSDIYDEAALKKIATPTQVWGLSSVNKKQLTESGTYVIHFYYSIGTSAKKTVALKVTI